MAVLDCSAADYRRGNCRVGFRVDCCVDCCGDFRVDYCSNCANVSRSGLRRFSGARDSSLARCCDSGSSDWSGCYCRSIYGDASSSNATMNGSRHRGSRHRGSHRCDNHRHGSHRHGSHRHGSHRHGSHRCCRPLRICCSRRCGWSSGLVCLAFCTELPTANFRGGFDRFGLSTNCDSHNGKWTIFELLFAA